MRGSYDWWAGTGLVVVAFVFLLLTAHLSVPPAEDAAMLMRYALHLAEGHGIVWNIGEPPIDGATDFLFMVMIAGLIKLGLGVEFATRLLIALAHLATVGLVYWYSRRVLGVSAWIASLAGLVIATSAAPLYVSTCFGAPVFAFFATCAWLCAVYLMLHPSNLGIVVGFGAFSLLTGLTRPEGVLLTLLMLTGIVIARGFRESRVAVGTWLLFVVILGGVYFLWRWDYFGHPLPNPFYKKGGGSLYIGGLKNSIRNFLGFNLLLLPLVAIAFIPSANRRQLFAAVFPVLGFVSLFILLSDEMNIYGRFQYVTLPMMVVVFVLSYSFLRNNLFSVAIKPSAIRGLYKIALFSAAAYYVFAYSLLVIFGHATPLFADGRYFVARELSTLASRGYYMAVTEAGLLPFYSRWKAIDTWGLNDKHIARSGRVSSEYLSQYKPALIMIHIRWTPLTPIRRANQWDEMCLTLIEYAKNNHYILVAAYTDNPFGNSCHLYYVNSDVPTEDRKKIAQSILQKEYRYWTGNRAINLVPILRTLESFENEDLFRAQIADFTITSKTERD